MCSGACRCLAALHAGSPRRRFQNLPPTPTPCWQLPAPSGLLAAPHAALKTPMTSLFSVFCFLSPFLQNLFCSKQAPGPSVAQGGCALFAGAGPEPRAWPTACVPCSCPACSLQRSQFGCSAPVWRWGQILLSPRLEPMWAPVGPYTCWDPSVTTWVLGLKFEGGRGQAVSAAGGSHFPVDYWPHLGAGSTHLVSTPGWRPLGGWDQAAWSKSLVWGDSPLLGRVRCGLHSFLLGLRSACSEWWGTSAFPPCNLGATCQSLGPRWVLLQHLAHFRPFQDMGGEHWVAKASASPGNRIRT